MKRISHLSNHAFLEEQKRRLFWARCLAVPFFLTGLVLLVSTVMAIFTFEFGELTKHEVTDTVVFLALFAVSLLLLRKSHLLFYQTLCRFCLHRIRQGELVCPNCGEDQTRSDLHLKRGLPDEDSDDLETATLSQQGDQHVPHRQ